MKRAEQLMKLQDSRKETIRRYRHREITHIEAIRLLRENDKAMQKIRQPGRK